MAHRNLGNLGNSNTHRMPLADYLMKFHVHHIVIVAKKELVKEPKK